VCGVLCDSCSQQCVGVWVLRTLLRQFWCVCSCLDYYLVFVFPAICSWTLGWCGGIAGLHSCSCAPGVWCVCVDRWWLSACRETCCGCW
jgi:hypothetical protein